jgi:hypothetical protein
MSSWVRQTPTVQGVVKTAAEPAFQPALIADEPPVSLEVKQYPMPEMPKKNRRPAAVTLPIPFEPSEQEPVSLEVRQFPLPEGYKPRNAPRRERNVIQEQPIVQQSVAKQPVAKQPVAKQPVAKQPVAQEQRAPVTRSQTREQSAKAAPPPPPVMKQIPKPSNPEVTVIIPLYNGVEFLEGSLESTRRQTFKNWVGIVAVNGHGKTGEPVISKVRALVASLGMSEVFDVINLPDIKGGAAAITKAAEIATTPFVAHLDCDDIWLPKKLETQMKLIDSDDEIGIVGTMCRYFGDSSDIPVLPPGELRKSDFVKRNPMIHSSVLIRRDLATYTDEFVAYDYDCWVRNMLYGVKIVNIDNILVFHRVHMKSFYNASGKQDPELVQKKYNLA